MDNSFDTWNKQKKTLDESQFSKHHGHPLPKARGVWMCHLGKNIGIEMNGGADDFSRPVVIIKRFNMNMFWAVPLSTKQKELTFYHNFTDVHGRAVSAVISQMRLLSVKRLKRYLYAMPVKEFEPIRAKLRGNLLG
jgi:mRNA interferase MazF